MGTFKVKQKDKNGKYHTIAVVDPVIPFRLGKGDYVEGYRIDHFCIENGESFYVAEGTF